LYGEVSGRDQGLRGQILSLVDGLKEVAFTGAVHEAHPDAWRQDDSNPSQQLPHLDSAYRRALAGPLGLRGGKAARADYCAASLSTERIERIAASIRQRFSVQDVVQSLVSDVNQPDISDAGASVSGGGGSGGGASGDPPTRRIDRRALCQWASSPAAIAAGFEAHSIFYDDDLAQDYSSPPSGSAAALLQPYLSNTVALRALECIFLASGDGGGGEEGRVTRSSSSSSSKKKKRSKTGGGREAAGSADAPRGRGGRGGRLSGSGAGKKGRKNERG